MRIYIEQYLIGTVLLSYWSIASAYRFLRRNGELWRYVCALSLACVTAVFCPLVPHAARVALMAALYVAAVPVLYVGKCSLWRGGLALIVSVLLYGGIVFAVGCIWHGSLRAALTQPLCVWLWVLLAAGYALYRVWAHACMSHHRDKSTEAVLRAYRVTIGGKTLTGVGMLDTGNRLYDARSGLPVILLSLAKIAAVVDDDEFTHLCKGDVRAVFPKARRMRCRSACGDGAIWVIRPDTFEVFSRTGAHIVYEVMVGLSFASAVRNETYDAILHPAMTEVD